MPKSIFLAAPESSASDLTLIDKLLVQLQTLTNGAVTPSTVYAPHLAIGDVGIETDAATYFTKALTAIQEAQVVIALLDGARTDDGVAFLMGYAFAAGKPVIGYRTDRRQITHPLIEGACATIASDVKGLAAALRAYPSATP